MVRERIVYLDKLKGFAILLVVMGHFLGISVGVKDSLFKSINESVHMPLFFFISGYFFDIIELYSFKQYLKKKTKQLLMPFLTFGIAFSLLYKGEMFSLFDNSIGFYWFLPALFLCSIMGRISLEISKRFHRKYRVFIFVLLYLIIGVIYKVFQNYSGYNGNVYISGYLNFYLFYVFGVFYSNYRKIKEILETDNAYLISFILFLVLLYFKEYWIIGIRWAGFFGVVFIIQMFRNNDIKLPRQLSYLGRNSLEIYVLHYFLLPSCTFLRPILEEFNTLIPNGNIFMFVVVSFLFAYPICCLSIILSDILKNSKYGGFLLGL